MVENFRSSLDHRAIIQQQARVGVCQGPPLHVIVGPGPEEFDCNASSRPEDALDDGLHAPDLPRPPSVVHKRLDGVAGRPELGLFPIAGLRFEPPMVQLCQRSAGRQELMRHSPGSAALRLCHGTIAGARRWCSDGRHHQRYENGRHPQRQRLQPALEVKLPIFARGPARERRPVGNRLPVPTPVRH
eukprot:SAG31_NODE_165_length_21701_cov_9.786409_14_plen_187_part_00